MNQAIAVAIPHNGIAGAYTSPVQPIPQGNYAHVMVKDCANSPRINPGDVLIVNLAITRFLADGLYVVEYAGQQLIRYLRDNPGGLQLFSASMPSWSNTVTPETCRVLGMVESAAQIRRVG